MNKSWLKLISLIIVSFAVLILSISCSKDSYQQAPQFTLRSIDGKMVSLSDFKGKVVILDFWATWCPPCRKEIPSFIELYQQYKGKGLEIIGIALDRQGPSVVEPFVKKTGINYHILYPTRKVIIDYGGIESIPTTFIIDKKGKIRHKYVGYRGKKLFEARIKELL